MDSGSLNLFLVAGLVIFVALLVACILGILFCCCQICERIREWLRDKWEAFRKWLVEKYRAALKSIRDRFGDLRTYLATRLGNLRNWIAGLNPNWTWPSISWSSLENQDPDENTPLVGPQHAGPSTSNAGISIGITMPPDTMPPDTMPPQDAQAITPLADSTENDNAILDRLQRAMQFYKRFVPTWLSANKYRPEFRTSQASSQCHQCSVAFRSIRKRKFLCKTCGHYFCHNCSRKIPFTAANHLVEQGQAIEQFSPIPPETWRSQQWQAILHRVRGWQTIRVCIQCSPQLPPGDLFA